MPRTRRTRLAAAALAAAVVLAAPAVALARGGRGGGDDGEGGDGGGGRPARAEVEVAGDCGAGARSRLKLEQEDSGIVAEFEVEGPPRATWRIALVHERRIVWQGRRGTGRGDSLSVERAMPGYPGANTVAALAWGPRGLTCRATATVAR